MRFTSLFQTLICLTFISLTQYLHSQPSNDFCTNAQPIQLEVGSYCTLVNYEAFNATFSNNETCSNDTNCDVWYSIVPTQNILHGRLGVFTGQCAFSIYESCDGIPFYCRGFNISDPEFSINVTPGVTHLLRISDYAASVCNLQFEMCFWEDQPPCTMALSLESDDTEICQDESTVIAAIVDFGTPPLTYIWDHNLPSEAQHTVTPAATTTYNVTVIDNNNCTQTAAITVQVHPRPVAGSFANTPVCEGFGTTIFGYGGGTYAWSGPNDYTSQFQNVNIAGMPSNSGTYTLTVTNSNGCTATNSTTIQINPAPVLSLQHSVATCQGDSAVLAVSGAVSYVWTGPNGFTSTLDTIVLHNTSAMQSGIYKVNGQGANLCHKIDSIQVTISPTYTYRNQTISCNFELSPGDQLMTTTGTYIDTLLSIHQCDSIIYTDFFNIGLEAKTSFYNDSILMANMSQAMYQWLDCETNLPIANETEQFFGPSQTGNYAVIITNPFGCTDTSDCVRVILTNTFNELDKWLIDVFPNPSHGQLYIKGITTPARYEILDLQGKNVENGTITDSWITLHEKGFFILRIAFENKIVTRKVLCY